MTALRISTFCTAALLFPSAAFSEKPATAALQAQPAFEMAIRDESSSPFIILLTVVDDRTGEARTGCTNANFLLGAIYLEKWGSFDRTTTPETLARHEEVEKIAIENRSHIFHFSSQAALDNIPFRYASACAEVARGRTARIAHRTGQITFGPFVKEPSIDRRSCQLPGYSLERKAARESGRIDIAFLVGPDGKPIESKVIRSSGSEGLDESARTALSACRFFPKTIDGQPVPEPAWTSTQVWQVAP